MTYKARPLYLLKPANNTPEVQQAMKSYLDNYWLPLHVLEDGDELYHYTNLDGLRGIIGSRAIWCSHVSTLNDPQEVEYGQEIVLEELRNAKEGADAEELRSFYNSILIQVDAFGKTLFHAFVACFCEDGDILSQWREYAESGGGYSLGFKITPNIRIARSTSDFDEAKAPHFRKVIYCPRKQRDLISEYLTTVAEGMKKGLHGSAAQAHDDTSSIVPAVMGVQAANVLLDMLLSFKHPAFEEENEWRLIRVTLEDHLVEHLQFREAAGGLIPYRPTPLFKDDPDGQLIFPLGSVSFGPSLDPSRTRAPLELFLHHAASKQRPVGLNPSIINIRGSGYSLR